MPSKIRVLPDHVINQIAAGEVIENPASVVKELVENSLDAGASDITVEITTGGRQLIRISDNGCGMTSDDALLCLERHGTSKIRDIDDLFALSTMGFRGEAVPSIASISKFTLMTCPKPDEGTSSKEGTMVIVEGGKILQCTPVVKDPGTTIEVKSLFYNVPVRKKFQKSPAYDASEIHKILSWIALANPFVNFRLVSDHKVLLSTSASHGLNFQECFKDRVGELLGTDFVEESIPLHMEHGEYILEGLIGLPSYTRQNRTGQHLFLNQRPIWSPLISHAVREGYGTSIPSQRFPVYALHLRMPGGLVDVNVHPQKREVRLRKEFDLKELVTQAVFKALQQRPMEKGVDMDFIPLPIPPQPSVEPIQSPKIVEPPPFWLNTKTVFERKEVPQPMTVSKQEEIFTKPEHLPISHKVLYTLRGYILIEKDGVTIIDQRRAHQRVIYERLTQHASSEKNVQTLLIPHSIEVSTTEANSLRSHLEMFQNVGISMREFGKNIFLVDAVPDCLAKTDLKALVLYILEDLQQFEKTEKIKKEQEKRIAMVSCRSALSKEVRLSVEEAQALVNQLMRCNSPQICPQGKKTMLRLDPNTLNF